jgi:hypothetical protein
MGFAVLSILPNDKHWLALFQQFCSHLRVPVANDSNIEGTIVSWFHSEEIVIGHQAGISGSPRVLKPKHSTVQQLTLSVILAIIPCRGFSCGFLPLGLSHEYPPNEGSWHGPAYTPQIFQGISIYQQGNLKHRIWP